MISAKEVAGGKQQSVVLSPASLCLHFGGDCCFFLRFYNWLAAFFDVGSVGSMYIFTLASRHSSVENIGYPQQSRDVVHVIGTDKNSDRKKDIIMSKKSSNEPKEISHRLSVGLSENTYNELRELAEKYGESIASVIRLVIEKNLGDYLGTIRYIDREQAENGAVSITAVPIAENLHANVLMIDDEDEIEQPEIVHKSEKKKAYEKPESKPEKTPKKKRKVDSSRFDRAIQIIEFSPLCDMPSQI